MKNKILFLICLQLISFAFAEKSEKIVVDGKKEYSSEIEYYDNGLIKELSLYDVSFKNYDLIIRETSISGSLLWNVQGTEYKARFDVLMEGDSIHFNSAFRLPKNKKDENDIKIQGDSFSNHDFYFNISQKNFVYQRGNQYWIKNNNSIYDKNSYGQVEKDLLIRPLARLYEKNHQILIGKYYCYEYNDGGFTYIRDESISFEKSYERNSIPKLYRFLNFYFLSTVMDVSTLPFIFLFDDADTYKNQNTIVSYDSSSFLQEGTILYCSENMKSVDGLPWASANGYGIGDTLFLTADIFTTFKIAIYNGFQSEKEYLYKQNSRAKRIQITNLDSLESMIYELQDTPEKQELLIQKKNDNENQVGRYKIQILEVYPGSKYKDLCIQAIIPVLE